jgi:hypothetical protein
MPMVSNPLEKYLQIHKYGTYKKSDDERFTYDRVEDIWDARDHDTAQENDYNYDADLIIDDDQVEQDEQNENDVQAQPVRVKPSQLIDLSQGTTDA